MLILYLNELKFEKKMYLITSEMMTDSFPPMSLKHDYFFLIEAHRNSVSYIVDIFDRVIRADFRHNSALFQTITIRKVEVQIR